MLALERIKVPPTGFATGRRETGKFNDESLAASVAGSELKSPRRRT